MKKARKIASICTIGALIVSLSSPSISSATENRTQSENIKKILKSENQTDFRNETINDHVKEDPITSGNKISSESVGDKPKLIVQDYVYSHGEIINLQSLVTATDTEDGDLTSQVVIETDYTEGSYGEFPVTYSVIDSDGNAVSVTIKIFVPEPIEKFSSEQIQDFDDILTTSARIYAYLQEIGFTDEQILRLSELPKKEDSFYETMQSSGIMANSTLRNTNNSSEAFTIETSDSEQIAQRISHITSVANRYSDAPIGSEYFNRDVAFYYLSHYVDNPYYPNFTKAYCHILVEQDYDVYDAYISTGTAMRNANNLIQMINKGTSIVYTSSSIDKMLKAESSVKNSVSYINDLRTLGNDTEDIASFTKDFVDSFERNYESAESVEALIQAINEDISVTGKDIDALLCGAFTEVLISAVLGNPLPTLILAGSSTFFEAYKTLADRAALAALKYTTSLRIGLRQYSTWE